jgi:hypothetical protein
MFYDSAAPVYIDEHKINVDEGEDEYENREHCELRIYSKLYHVLVLEYHKYWWEKRQKIMNPSL